LEKKLVDMVDKLSALISEIEEKVLNSGELSKLTSRQLTYIETIRKDSLITPSEIAQKLNISKPTVSVAINKLLREGYFQRVSDEKDKRKMLLKLSEKGLRISKRHEQAHKLIAQSIRASLTREEISAFIEIVSKIQST
jgi:DNA-binding MarR family transcriptional regulator